MAPVLGVIFSIDFWENNNTGIAGFVKKKHQTFQNVHLDFVVIICYGPIGSQYILFNLASTFNMTDLIENL